ncbi:PaaI family thioesterase [Alicyclobacillus cycloheptanicus]|uniref:Uncharacterized protein (TIGR00369 family) n=1 Tax=Alicyclobacillus cycloheptanicus TaxID=1457 RepID=A0ABT9XK58_9BACL|nr:PaaI family thioesterase [Alicyclobacillus cycloheptanicus]MDQ0190692.1 uncharacterized protein (TIGR00369 family) [Alicyclobacillus cycloheptanicus]WDM00293.1 PaaI family thioesterase [Alicyclobacillus cycloheptanicus]
MNQTDVDFERIQHLQDGAYWRHIHMYIIEVSEERAVVRMDIEPEVLQIYGNVHGGVLASLIDSSMSVMLHTTLEGTEQPVTSQMNVYYLQAARGERAYLDAVATLIKRGGRLAVCRADVYDDEGTLVAYGTGEFYIRRPPRSEGTGDGATAKSGAAGTGPTGTGPTGTGTTGTGTTGTGTTGTGTTGTGE